MAKNIFSQMKEYVKQPNRNTFDLSFQNNLTMEFGKLYPVFVKDVIPGDSFRITPSFGLRFMPTAFPVQTRMQANLHFFYVRNRNLWKDWPDFIGRTKQGLTLPYLANPLNQAKTRALGDYMGLPTTLVGNYGVDVALTWSDLIQKYDHTWSSASSAPGNGIYVNNWVFDARLQSNSFGHLHNIAINNFIHEISNSHQETEFNGSTHYPDYRYGVLTPALHEIPASAQTMMLQLSTRSMSGTDLDFVVCFWRKRPTSAGGRYELCARIKHPHGTYDNTTGKLNINFDSADDITACSDTGAQYKDHIWEDVLDALRVYREDEDSEPYVDYKISIMSGVEQTTAPSSVFFNAPGSNRVAAIGGTPDISLATTLNTLKEWTVNFLPVNVREIDTVADAQNVYKSNLRVSALPFRAYESIYNAFYRNQQNDPFTINGVAEYNKFIPTNEGGADNTEYALRYRNWELDYLTSAVQSPQQGIAPLVGVTASGEFTFQNEDGTTFTAQATVGDDGDSITGIQIQSDADNTTPNGAVQTGTLRAMREIITNGISISDFRNVNALQRWLEVNMRRGFRYKDQLMSHFGVDAEYKELDMPEFIGGMSEAVETNQVTQTAEGSEGSPLGSYAGQASILAQSKHSITHYCDEHGYIIGILSVSPVPNYSQLMPKHFIKHDTLDFFFPEFGHIGMQPLTYEEVCPIQSYAAGDAITDVFGYQRAWSDYIQSIDEVHGLMRTELRNFLINRQFDTRPELGAEFLHINPNDVNDVFTVTDVTDKIVGALWFDVQAKRPIPKFGIPRLEA